MFEILWITFQRRLGENTTHTKGKGMTQEDICDALGLDRGYISSIENGKRNPTLSTLKN